jgi:hypothetical protein
VEFVGILNWNFSMGRSNAIEPLSEKGAVLSAGLWRKICGWKKCFRIEGSHYATDF